MKTLKFDSLLPVRTTEEDMRGHCAAFGLTLVSWSRSAHELEVTVKEDVTDERHDQIAAAMSQQMAASLIKAVRKQ